MAFDQDWYAETTKQKGPLKKFEIVFDQDAVVLRGGSSESSNQVLTGSINISAKEPISGKIKLVLGRRIRHSRWVSTAGDHLNGGQAVDFVFNNRAIHETYVVPESQKFAAGDHSWSFSIPIEPDSASSLEGPRSTYVVYRLKCIVERGFLVKDLVQKKHVRVHRTLSPDSLALQHPMVTDSFWAGKGAYKIQTPTKGVIYGTRVPIEYRFSPFHKAIKPVSVRCVVSQVTSFHAGSFTCVPFVPSSVEKDVAEDRFAIDPGLETDEEGWYNVRQTIALPRDLSKCCQTYREDLVPDMEIRHYLKYQLGISNEDGHVSEIQGKLPIHIYFTQRMHMEGNEVTGVPEDSESVDAALDDIPPDYEHAKLDQLYDEVSHSGYATPVPRSGAVTPRAFGAGNLQTLLEGVEAGRDSPSEDDDAGDAAAHEAHANALRNQLNDVINPVSGLSSRTQREGRQGALNVAHNRASPSTATGHGSLGSSPLAYASMTPAQELDDPFNGQQQTRPGLPQQSGSTGSLSGHLFHQHRHNHSHSPSPPTASGSMTPNGAVRSTGPTRPSSPAHVENLCKVPSYHTAITTPAPTGGLGSQHGGEGLPTYGEVEESTSRSNSVGGGYSPHPPSSGGAGSGSITPSAGKANKSGFLGGLLHHKK